MVFRRCEYEHTRPREHTNTAVICRWATSVLMLVIYMWRQFAREARKESVLARALVRPSSQPTFLLFTPLQMLASPYAVFAAWAVGALFVRHDLS
jgi:hypothetical protein